MTLNEAVESLQKEFRDIAIEIMSSAWIPVAERLPENSGYYLVTDRIPNASVVGESYFDAFSQQWHDAWDVIAWMPQPKPYKEET